MKTILISCLLLLSLNTHAQNKIYTITEQFSGAHLVLDRIIVTDPEGQTTTHNITHFMANVVTHDSEFNKILNGIISKGYELLNSSPSVFESPSQTITRTWFLKQI